MFKFVRRFWNYLTAGANQKFDEKADPKIQLEQAIIEAQDQHRRLTEQAANVIAQQKQTEIRLNRATDHLEKLNANARQAVLMSEEATNKGDAAKAAEYARAAETFANQLISTEGEVKELEAMALQSTQAADQAKAAVAQNGQVLQKKLSERQKLLGQLEQAKMQEQMNSAMTSLSQTVGQDIPSLDQVRDKIEARHARAKGMSELQGQSVEGRMLEIEQAAQNTQAQARLSEIRAQLGLAPADGAGASAETPAAEATPATEPAGDPGGTAQPG